MDGFTPLHWAAWCCRAEVAKCLLNTGADYVALANNGESPFQIACRAGHQVMVDFFCGYAEKLPLFPGE